MKFLSRLLVILITALMSAPGVQAQEAHPPLSVATVRTCMVIEQTVPTLVEVAGTLQAVERAALAAKVMGAVTSVPVVLGSRVNKGDLLVKISAQEIAAQFDQAQARFRQVEQESFA